MCTNFSFPSVSSRHSTVLHCWHLTATPRLFNNSWCHLCIKLTSLGSSSRKNGLSVMLSVVGHASVLWREPWGEMAWEEEWCYSKICERRSDEWSQIPMPRCPWYCRFTTTAHRSGTNNIWLKLFYETMRAWFPRQPITSWCVSTFLRIAE